MTLETPRAPAHGSTLLEAMIALSVLLIGMLGMAQLQIWGVSSNQGARSHGQALEIARELTAALERLPYDDTLLATVPSSIPPANFGEYLQLDGTLNESLLTVWDDAMTAKLVNVRPNTAFDPDTVDSSKPAYQRHWAVWAPTGQTAAFVRVVAVSVVYHERAFQQARQVILLTQISNAGAGLANIAAYR